MMVLRRLCGVLALSVAGATHAGITIHFEGSARDSTAVDQITSRACEEARKKKWVCDSLTTDTARRDSVNGRLIEELLAPDKTASVRGIVIYPHEMSEPLYLIFVGLRTKNFIKTQFAGAETHVQVVSILRSVAQEFSQLRVLDEGEYWDTEDKQRLEQHLDGLNRGIAKLLKEKSNARGPVRLATGRILDIVGEPSLRLGALSLDWPQGYKSTKTERGLRMDGPDGESVIISVFSQKQGASEEGNKRFPDGLNSFVNDMLPKQAARVGVIVRPLRLTSLDGNRSLHSIASQGTRMFRDYYFLQYFLIGRRSGIFITVEGYGNALEKTEQFDKVMTTGQWDE